MTMVYKNTLRKAGETQIFNSEPSLPLLLYTALYWMASFTATGVLACFDFTIHSFILTLHNLARHGLFESLVAASAFVL